MDFADSPEHAVFRGEFRRWLDENLPPRFASTTRPTSGRTRPRDVGEAHPMAEDDACRGLGRDLVAQGIWRPRCQFHAAGHVRRGICPRTRSGIAGRERPQPARPDLDPLGHRGSAPLSPRSWADELWCRAIPAGCRRRWRACAPCGDNGDHFIVNRRRWTSGAHFADWWLVRIDPRQNTTASATSWST